ELRPCARNTSLVACRARRKRRRNPWTKGGGNDNTKFAAGFSRNLSFGTGGGNHSERGARASPCDNGPEKRNSERRRRNLRLGHVGRRALCRRPAREMESSLEHPRGRSDPIGSNQEVSGDSGIWRRLYGRCLLYLQSARTFGARATAP